MSTSQYLSSYGCAITVLYCVLYVYYISPHYQRFELRVYSISTASTDWCESCYIRMYYSKCMCVCVNCILLFTTYCLRLPTNTFPGECHSSRPRALLQLHLLLRRELQPLPEVHPILLSGVHCVPSVNSKQLLQWVQCGVHHPQPDKVCELPVHCHRTSSQPKGNPHCRGRDSHAK